MHLISTDLPAPLSPSSAVTSPARTSKSTSVSACTGPNDFETPRISSSARPSVGALAVVEASLLIGPAPSRPRRAAPRGGRPPGTRGPGSTDARRLAGALQRSGAQVGHRDRLVL